MLLTKKKFCRLALGGKTMKNVRPLQPESEPCQSECKSSQFHKRESPGQTAVTGQSTISSNIYLGLWADLKSIYKHPNKASIVLIAWFQGRYVPLIKVKPSVNPKSNGSIVGSNRFKAYAWDTLNWQGCLFSGWSRMFKTQGFKPAVFF